MIVWSCGKELKRTFGGRKQTLNCSNCKKATTFYEAIVDDSFKIYFVVELWKKTKRVMQCGECLYVSDFYEVYPEEKQKEEEARAKLEADRLKAENEAKQKALEEQARQEAVARKAREAAEKEAKQKMDQQVDDELEALKRKLGK